MVLDHDASEFTNHPVYRLNNLCSCVEELRKGGIRVQPAPVTPTVLAPLCMCMQLVAFRSYRDADVVH